MTEPTPLDAAYKRAAAASNLIQGEVLDAADACVVLADAAAPLSREAAEVAAGEGATTGLVVVPHAVDRVVVLTQTCDLQRTTLDEHTSLVAPVMEVSPAKAREALRGRRPALAGLPWISDTAAADLSRITTVERSVLVGAASQGKPRTPLERFHFSETVHGYLTRPALPDEINAVLAPLVKRMADKHDKSSPEGACVHDVAEMRLEAAPDLDDPSPALTVLLILEVQDLPSVPVGSQLSQQRIDELTTEGATVAAQAVLDASVATALREAWTALAECWIAPAVARAADSQAVDTVEITVLNDEELSYARSRNAPILDLRYLSTRPE